VSRNYRILLAAVVALLAVGGYWKLLLAPKRAQAATLQEQVATEQAQLAQTQSLISTYAGAKAAYKANYATVLRLGKAVPTDDDTRSLLVQLDAAAKRSSVDFDTINLNGTGGSSLGTAPTTPGAISAGGYSAMPFSFAFDGTFATLGDLFSRLERFVTVNGDAIRVNGRLLRIETISLQPAAGGWPGISAQVGASSYIVPQTAATTPSTTTTAPSTEAATAPGAASAG
jgi:hypothetical protein